MKERIISAFVFGIIFLPLTILGGFSISILAYFLATVALFEILRMKKIAITSVPGIIALLTMWVLMIPTSFDLSQFILLEKTSVFVIALLLLLTYSVVVKNSFDYENAAFVFLSIFYVGVGFYYFIEIRDIGLVYAFFPLFTIWATDSGAYFIGRKIGKNKLWPEISPNKTIEGSIGGVVCAVIVGIIFILFTSIDLTIAKMLILAIILSIFGQIGDLVESGLKRHFGVKDSGKIMPGHGGILDRFDSLLFVWPLFYFFYHLLC